MLIPIKTVELSNLHFDVFDTDTDFHIIASYKKKGVFPQGNTQYKMMVYDTISKETIETYYLQNADELREMVRSFINAYKIK